MKKIAFITEGQTEYIFLRNMLFIVFDASMFNVECFELYSNNLKPIPYPHICPSPKINFTIINIGNDERVISFIKERADRLNYDFIFGLRDMYSSIYKKISPHVINEDLNRNFMEKTNSIIANLSNSKKIKIIFSIMEIEAWFLGMNNIFSKYNSSLTIDKINNELSINLLQVNPENIFYHPASILQDIFDCIDEKYDKSRDIVESLVSKIDITDIRDLLNSNKCSSFKYFCEQIHKETSDLSNYLSATIQSSN